MKYTVKINLKNQVHSQRNLENNVHSQKQSLCELCDQAQRTEQIAYLSGKPHLTCIISHINFHLPHTTYHILQIKITYYMSCSHIMYHMNHI